MVKPRDDLVGSLDASGVRLHAVVVLQRQRRPAQRVGSRASVTARASSSEVFRPAIRN
jgi:hypothetical protein